MACALCELKLEKVRDTSGTYHLIGEEMAPCEDADYTATEVRTVIQKSIHRRLNQLEKDLVAAQECVKKAQQRAEEAQQAWHMANHNWGEAIKREAATDKMAFWMFVAALVMVVIFIPWKIADWLFLGKGFW